MHLCVYAIRIRFLFLFNLFNRTQEESVGKNTKWHENKRTIIVVYIYMCVHIMQFVCVCCVYVNVFHRHWYFVVYCVLLDLHTGIKKNCIHICWLTSSLRFVSFLFFFPFHFNSFQFWFQWFCCNRMKTAFGSMVSTRLSHSLYYNS